MSMRRTREAGFTMVEAILMTTIGLGVAAASLALWSSSDGLMSASVAHMRTESEHRRDV